MFRRFGVLLAALLLLWAGACNPSLPQAGLQAGPRSWIEGPQHGQTLPLGPIEVTSRARHPVGIAQVELWVDGAIVARSDSPDPTQSLFIAQQTWRPREPGAYVLQVRAKSAAGHWGEFVRADVTVSADLAALATPSETATPQPTATRTPTPSPSPTETLAPAEAPQPTETLAPRAPAQPTAVPPTAAPQPTETPVIITAAPVMDSGSALGAPTFSSADFYYGAEGCGPQQVTIDIRPLAGKQVTSVRLYFMLASKSTGQGAGWTPVDMTQVDGRWTRTIAATEIPGYSAYGLAWFQFYFLATEADGKQTKTPGYYTSVTLHRCG